MQHEPGRLVPVCPETDPDASTADSYTVTVTVCLSHGDSKSYPVNVTLRDTDRVTALALSDAIRNAVRNAV